MGFPHQLPGTGSLTWAVAGRARRCRSQGAVIPAAAGCAVRSAPGPGLVRGASRPAAAERDGVVWPWTTSSHGAGTWVDSPSGRRDPKRPRGRPPSPQGPRPRAEIQRAYRERRAATPRPHVRLRLGVTRLLCMRLGTGPSGATLDILHTVRRVTPNLRRTCGLETSFRMILGVVQDALDLPELGDQPPT